MKTFYPRVLAFVAILLASLFLIVSAHRNLTSLESALFQLLILASSFVGSYLMGRREARNIAHEMITAHARPAFRRLLSLYKSISRVSSVSSHYNDAEDDETKLKIIQAIVDAQIDAADDALEDWKDLCPELVQEAKERIGIEKTSREADR